MQQNRIKNQKQGDARVIIRKSNRRRFRVEMLGPLLWVDSDTCLLEGLAVLGVPIKNVTK